MEQAQMSAATPALRSTGIDFDIPSDVTRLDLFVERIGAAEGPAQPGSAGEEPAQQGSASSDFAGVEIIRPDATVLKVAMDPQRYRQCLHISLAGNTDGHNSGDEDAGAPAGRYVLVPHGVTPT